MVARRLRVLQEVGLGYLRLGQPATTLSGGEAQRLKIAAELGARQTSDHLYVLDEPTTGLHLDDIKKLLVVLGRLVDTGNTVLVVEHHLDVIKTADWVVDLGPEGGEAGGAIIAEGTPEQVAQTDGSYTGKYLREVLPASEWARSRRPGGMNFHHLLEAVGILVIGLLFYSYAYGRLRGGQPRQKGARGGAPRPRLRRPHRGHDGLPHRDRAGHLHRRPSRAHRADRPLRGRARRLHRRRLRRRLSDLDRRPRHGRGPFLAVRAGGRRLGSSGPGRGATAACSRATPSRSRGAAYVITVLAFALLGRRGLEMFSNMWVAHFVTCAVGIGVMARLFYDVTEQFRLGAERARFRAILDQATDAIRIIDCDTQRVVDVNRADCAISGLSREELVGRSRREFWPDDPEARRLQEAALAETYQTGSARTLGSPFRTHGGDDRARGHDPPRRALPGSPLRVHHLAGRPGADRVRKQPPARGPGCARRPSSPAPPPTRSTTPSR